MNLMLLREIAVVVRGTQLIRRETTDVLRESHEKSRGKPLFLRERVINIRTRTVKVP